MRRLDGIIHSLDMSLSKFREMEKDREAWCVVLGVTESGIRLSNHQPCFERWSPQSRWLTPPSPHSHLSHACGQMVMVHPLSDDLVYNSVCVSVIILPPSRSPENKVLDRKSYRQEFSIS